MKGALDQFGVNADRIPEHFLRSILKEWHQDLQADMNRREKDK
jgi:hypothetical protein